ncbi:hypothetical protein Vadar_001782 [Vaccinium darrowii]|uniref:Uncharacterized protein n=1 Tax=Vaccinium darrowii TaxID=229202 RepID=A0ACB7X7G0_9ERIC|nr:hypothetical protein Vadar_001782 [Vaccinium darrowii]
MVDRFLLLRPITSDKLRLVGLTSMLISSEIEERKALTIPSLLAMTGNNYSRKELPEMEIDILHFFNFVLECLSYYLSELSLLDCSYLEYLPSQEAASAIFLAMCNADCEMRPWSLETETFSGYRPSELKDCVLHLHRLHGIVSKEDGYLQRKYKNREV